VLDDVVLEGEALSSPWRRELVSVVGVVD